MWIIASIISLYPYFFIGVRENFVYPLPGKISCLQTFNLQNFYATRDNTPWKLNYSRKGTPISYLLLRG